MKYPTNTSRGFAALIGILIISTILLTMVLDMSQGAFLNDSDIISSLDYQKSRALAHSCADTALTKLVEDPNYTPSASGENIEFGDTACSILSISTSSNIYTIKTSSDINDAISNFTITAALSQDSLSILSESN